MQEKPDLARPRCAAAAQTRSKGPAKSCMERVEMHAAREKALIADGEFGIVADLRVQADFDIRHVGVDGRAEHEEALTRVLEGDELLRPQAAERVLPCHRRTWRESKVVTTEGVGCESETEARKGCRGIASPARQRSRAAGFGEGRGGRIGPRNASERFKRQIRHFAGVS